MDSFAEILRTSGISKGMSEKFIEYVTSLAELKEYPKEAVIIHEDARDRDVFVLVEGKVSINLYVPGSLDRMESIITLRANQVFGEFALIDGAPRSASVRADTTVKCYRINGLKLLEKCETDPDFGYRLMNNLAAILASRIRDTTLLVRNNIIW